MAPLEDPSKNWDMKQLLAFAVVPFEPPLQLPSDTLPATPSHNLPNCSVYLWATVYLMLHYSAEPVVGIHHEIVRLEMGRAD